MFSFTRLVSALAVALLLLGLAACGGSNEGTAPSGEPGEAAIAPEVRAAWHDLDAEQQSVCDTVDDCYAGSQAELADCSSPTGDADLAIDWGGAPPEEEQTLLLECLSSAVDREALLAAVECVTLAKQRVQPCLAECPASGEGCMESYNGELMECELDAISSCLEK